MKLGRTSDKKEKKKLNESFSSLFNLRLKFLKDNSYIANVKLANIE